MNTEKLYTLCRELQNDITETKLIVNFNNLFNAIQNVVNNPSDNNAQNTLSTSLQVVYSSLEKSIVNELSPSWEQMIKKIGGFDKLGKQMQIKIEGVFQRNKITAATALQEIKKLQKDVTEFSNGVNSIVQGFSIMGLEKDELKENESEIGFLIPRELVSNDLAKLGNEIKEIVFILNTLTEFVSGKKESFKIKTISSSDFFITIAAETVLWIFVFSKAVEWLLDQYKKLLEIKNLHNELKEKGIPKDKLKGIEEHANSLMEKAVEDIVEEIDKDYYGGKDKPRRNELNNGLKIALNKLVNRIDKGYNIEIRINPPKTTTNNEQTTEETEKLELYYKVKDLSDKIEFVKVTGEHILSLPESKKEN